MVCCVISIVLLSLVRHVLFCSDEKWPRIGETIYVELRQTATYAREGHTIHTNRRRTHGKFKSTLMRNFRLNFKLKLKLRLSVLKLKLNVDKNDPRGFLLSDSHRRGEDGFHGRLNGLHVMQVGRHE